MIGNLLIIGDSYSTYKGRIPEGFAPYYSEQGEHPTHKGSAMKEECTWWYRLRERTGANIVQNNSWSGSTVCYTGRDGVDCSETSSFISRYRKLRNSGFFTENKIDTVIVFGGTNDSWINVELGEEKYSDFREEDLYTVLPAFCYLMSEIKKDLSEANIIFIANSDIKREIINCIKNAAEKLGVTAVELVSVEKTDGHPTPRGMEQICDQIINKIMN